MRNGELIAGRFEIERLAGQGGMGMLYRARDLEVGAPVAIKLLRGTGSSAELEQRFLREARLLSDMRHPGIVRHIAHGMTAAGEPFLAMEWLEGEDLCAHLKRLGRPMVSQTIALGARIAEALGAAHARGITHRDVKPHNIFVVGGELEHPKLIDLGLARSLAQTRALTRSDVFMGTPAYAAPEQVRSAKLVDARADLFSLGCVLFECLTGRPAFAGDHVMAILAKILFEAPPHASELCTDVPLALGDLVARMLAKDPSARPPNAATLAAELLAIRLDAEALPRQPSPRATLTATEQQLLCVILVAPEGGGNDWDETLSAERGVAPRDKLRALVTLLGGHVEVLSDCSIIATLTGNSTASDQVVKAARCALEIRASLPEARVALATGYGVLKGRLPMGELIDRAVKLVRDQAKGRLPGERASGTILLDVLTAGLLEPRFVLDGRRGASELVAEREAGESARLLLGKPSPCVGRERELGMLTGHWDECVSEPLSRAVLIVGEAGLGKSRLCHEFLRAVRRRAGELEVAPAIWAAKGDPIRVGSPFGLVGQLVRRAAGLYDGEALRLRQDKLRACVGARFAGDDAERVTGFLGELVGAPFPDEHGLQLRLARQDPVLMGDQLRRAFSEFITAECRARPLLLVLDDLHWGDMPSVQLVHEALRRLEEQPLFVLSLARPQVHELFPKLTLDGRWQEVRLRKLSRKASTLFVRQALGAEVPEEQIDRVVVQADGNAFYLEELVRAVADGGGGTLPGTVLAMVQARFSALEPVARQVLRAGSIFGESFWVSGAAALASGPRGVVDEWLPALVEREFLQQRQESKFPGEQEYVFRHALARDAVYETLTEQDREVGHRFVAEWLEKAGEKDPLVLAEHWERGQEKQRAATLYLRAATYAFQGNDLRESVTRAQHALKLGPPREVEIALLAQLTESLLWANEWVRAEAHSEELLRYASPGGLPWIIGGVGKALSSLFTGRLEEWLPTWPRLIEAKPQPEAIGYYTLMLGSLALMLDLVGKSDVAGKMIAWLDPMVTAVGDNNPCARAWLEGVYGMRLGLMQARPWDALEHSLASRATFKEAGYQRMALMERVYVGMNLWLLGRRAEAEAELRATLGADEELGLSSSFRTFFLIQVMAERGALEEARREGLQMVEVGRARGLPQHEGRGLWALADVERLRGEWAEAERAVAAALVLFHPTFPFDHAAAMVTQAEIHLRQGRATEAVRTAGDAMRRFEALEVIGFRPAFAPLVHAEALRASGDLEGASMAIAAARDQLLSRAATIDDEGTRRSFLENVPENARTLALARAWLG